MLFRLPSIDHASFAEMSEAELCARCLTYEPLHGAMLLEGQVLSPTTRSLLWRQCRELAERVRSEVAYAAKHGPCVYVGLAGMAFALRAASDVLANEDLANAADVALELHCAHDVRGNASLLCGEAGTLVVDALLRPAHAEQDVARFLELASSADADEAFDDEWLYGRAGLLMGCLILAPQARAHVSAASVHRLVRLADSLAQHLLQRGQAQASAAEAWHAQGVPPLLYEWHGHCYIGAAHGLLGSAMALLGWLRAVRCSDRPEPLASTAAAARLLIVQALDWALAQVDAAGNLPARAGEPSPLVQFCHGAPGAALVFAFGAQELELERFREAAVRFGEVTYEYGLLRKGPGLCHGLAGNGWVMLAMLRLTRDPLWLLRACQFAQAIRSEGVRTMSRTPDRPWSLFEGRAGALAFLAALCQDDPAAARFPFFECF